LKIGKLKTKTLLKFIDLVILTVQIRRVLTVNEIMNNLGCCKGTAYQYQRALRCMFPEGHFKTREDIERERQRGQQQCLI
jgi:hypothetical protein